MPRGALLRTAACSAVVFIVVSVVGLLSSFTFDAGEKCGSAGYGYDVLGLRQSGPPPAPFSLRCTPDIDLVPGWVNPLFWLSGALGLASATLWLVLLLLQAAGFQRRRRRQ